MSETLKLRIEKQIYGGSGLARHEGKAIFTPYTLAGELVTAAVTQSKSNFSEAALNAVLEPSAERALPPCPYFGACGGCHYQHALYQEQLTIKAAILQETLTRAKLAGLPEIEVHASDPFAYRNRIRLHINPASSRLAYRERFSHHVIEVSACPIAAPELEVALTALSKISEEKSFGKIFSQAELSINHDGSQLLLALWAHSRLGGVLAPPDAGRLLAQICEALQAAVPALCGGGVLAHTGLPQPAAQSGERSAQATQKQRRKQGQPRQAAPAGEQEPGSLVATWGSPRMLYQVGEFAYQVSLGAFFQVNRPLIETLVQLATRGRGGRLAWDLYAGVGLFSRVLAGSFAQVVAVEGAPISSADLRQNLGSPHQGVRGSTLAFLRREAGRLSQTASRGQSRAAAATHTDSALHPDFVLVDPPRAGLGEEVTRLLAEIRPPQITYVSCDPSTLSRDLRGLLDSGYQLQQLHMVDLFPQTFHLESVAMLSLG